MPHKGVVENFAKARNAINLIQVFFEEIGPGPHFGEYNEISKLFFHDLFDKVGATGVGA